jgi:hypothetical protein
VHRTEFSAVIFFKSSCDGLTEVLVVIFQGNGADICQVIIRRNINLTWVDAFIILHVHSLEYA